MTTTPPQRPQHEPVMLHEAVEGLAVRPGGRYVDATAGLGGHAEAVLEAASPGRALLGIDAAPDALAAAAQRLARFGAAVIPVQGHCPDPIPPSARRAPPAPARLPCAPPLPPTHRTPGPGTWCSHPADSATTWS